MNTKDLTIGILSVTAVILLAALMIIHALSPQPAMAYAQRAVSGNFHVTTSQLDDTTELLIMLDTMGQVMNVYGFNLQTARIELVQQIDITPLSQNKRKKR